MKGIDFLADLNESQQQAVKTVEGPVLVIAGAGSGKTRVLTYRIAFLLQKGVKPSSILALTFTNKAAGEMKERISKITGEQTAKYLWMGTFHSIFARILRVEAEKLGYTPTFTIYDSSDSKSLVRSIIREMQLDDKIYKTGAVASRISSAKNNLITASRYASDSSYQESDKANKIPLFAEIYKTYSERCFRANTMDFDDLLLNTNILFRDFPETLAHYRERFKYVLVDEYQDTNYSQYLIVNKLASTHNNICVVGDDAQSIYSFRGARIENILHFKNDYPEHKVFKLEQNYRSTQTIVNAANGIISNNTEQIKKTVYSKNEEGEKITVYQAISDIEEGVIVASDIYGKRLESNVQWHDIAILYRTNAQSRIFEETLRKRNIPYKIYGGQSFYDRKEIKDSLSYFRLTINHSDEEALRRVINYPKRGIGDTSVEKLFELAKANGSNVWEVVQNVRKYPDYYNSGAVAKLHQFSELVKRMGENIGESDAYTKASEIIDISGLRKEWKESSDPEDRNRLENMEELLNGIKIFTEEAQTNGEPCLLSDYLQGVALLTDQDNEKEEDLEKVTLMTIHSAKGLEFKYVYIVGFEDTLFPSPMSVGSVKELEEERRLFYVALTRAEKQIIISFALNRYKWGNLEISRPSRFLRELDPHLLQYPQVEEKLLKEESAKEKKNYTFAPKGGIAKEPPMNFGHKPNLKKVVLHQTPTTDVSFGNGTLEEGDRVEHERFGKGIILSIEGTPPNNTATVDFELSGSKKLLLRFAKLTKI